MIDEYAGSRTLDQFESERTTPALNELTLMRQPPLTDQVLQILLDRIKEGVYPPGDQLPPENELIEEFRISRATLRSAYAKMEERNLIQRRQGVGTFVSKQLNIANPLLEMIDFNDRITMQGYSPGFKQLGAEMVQPSPELTKALEIQPDDELLRVEKLWTANEIPIIFIVNHIPVKLFKNRFSQTDLLSPGFTEPLFWFLRHKCHLPIDHLASSITPEIVKQAQLPIEFSEYHTEEPLLIIEDVGFMIDGSPIFHSLEHLLGPAKKFETIRKIL